ncbi:RNA polymerase sigma factor [Baekduia sp. Peel2402]|uniref:RNA polymerase sigma factor n=1 Tax=Baekduia sp. Peel2402 TaxID=3458296 RepID=UPI00403E7101
MTIRPTSRTDGELLRAATSDPDAIAELYARHERVVATYLARQSRDAELAADLTAETFCRALLSAGKYHDTGESAIGWLLGIARNLLLDSWRRGSAETRARARLGVTVSVSDEALERIEALIDSAAEAERLQDALDALSPDQRAAVRGHVLDERPYPELAAELGVSEPTVRQRVSRGLARMRTTLEGPQR